jgi:hypothetical protein
MNRRHLLFAAVACGLGGLVAPSARADVERKVICRKRLGAAATTLRFTRGAFSAKQALYLKVSGNGLWLNGILWQDNCHVWREVAIKRNLPPDVAFHLPLLLDARKIVFAVTPLPLLNRSTDVALMI